jgi:phage shock protein PspC (stress-responsive transcriptional regulator)
MDKAININLGGILFSIDEEAYRILRDYLQAIDLRFRNIPGGAETIEDIESRIAEIFQSQKGLTGVITRESVEAMINIIGKPEDFGQAEPAEARREYPGQKKKMFRNPDDKIIGGVCGGMGLYLNTDPVWIRLLFVLFIFMGGMGLFVYLALWIALPSAIGETRKKEMYGTAYYKDLNSGGEPYRYSGSTSRVGNAFNEVFRAIGKVIYIFVRIFLILIGISFVLTGFMTLVTFIMVFIFKFPGAFSTDAAGFDISYLPDFLNYIVTPTLAPWITALIAVAVTLPLLALIYGGIRLIFWFSVRDGFIWLTGFIIWVVSLAVLSIMLFNEGVSFAETAKTSSKEYFKESPDTLYLVSGAKISDLQFDNEIKIPDDEYRVYISDEKREVYIRTYLDIRPDEANSTGINIRKRSAGRSRNDAMEKTERLIYNYKITGDTLFLDEYFAIPSGTKWSLDNVGATVYAPVGTIIYMDKNIEMLLHSYNYNDDDYITDPRGRYWVMTEDGLSFVEPVKGRRK